MSISTLYIAAVLADDQHWIPALDTFLSLIKKSLDYTHGDL